MSYKTLVIGALASLDWGTKWCRPIQQLDRISNVYKGAVAGGATRNAEGKASGSSACGCLQ